MRRYFTWKRFQQAGKHQWWQDRISTFVRAVEVWRIGRDSDWVVRRGQVEGRSKAMKLCKERSGGKFPSEDVKVPQESDGATSMDMNQLLRDMELTE